MMIWFLNEDFYLTSVGDKGHNSKPILSYKAKIHRQNVQVKQFFSFFKK